ncbi:hypothetical protein CL654_00315 [bacterium]|nr:hypothetical protein [bacterium]|tara:strand:+ start:2191 stop:2700 length:510 start_codon:yes stop_codon:yes gene_type:complete
MEEGKICQGDKYTYKKRTICLPVTLKGLPDQLETEGHTLLRKSTFHISLVCIGRLIDKHGIEVSDFEEKVLNDFCDFVKENEVSFGGYGEFRFVTNNDRRTVIVMSKVSNLDKFFQLLNSKYNLNLETPPAHVTLYTLQPELGIFLVDGEDLDSLSKTVEVPEGIQKVF